MTAEAYTLPSKVAAIRPATEADTEALIALGLAFIRESSYADHVAENPAQIGRVIAYLLAQPMATILVAERDGAVVGMIGLAVVPHLFSGVLTAGELVFFLHPDHRGTAGVRLLTAAEAWARGVGAQAISMIAPAEAVGRFYQRFGYSQLEVAFTKRL